MARASFDAGAFYAALDAQRMARDLTWKMVAEEAEVSASTLTRMGQGKRPDVDSLAALCAWSGLDADDFMRGDGADRGAEPLAVISSFINNDPNLTRDGAKAMDAMVKATYEQFRQDRR